MADIKKEGERKMGVYVRYLHAYPSLGSVEVLDGNIPVVRRLEYGQVTPYFYAEAPEGFRLETEDGSRSWGKETPGDGGTITWVLTEKEGSPWMIPIQDMERGSEEGEAVLRLVNLAVPTLDLYMGGLPEEMEMFLEQVEEGEASEYKGTESGRYFADLCMGAEWNVLARIPELHLAGGVWYSLYVIGNAEQWNVRLVMDGTI